MSVTVIYVGGMGRSGSTLVERALARVPGFVATGEVVHLWSRGLRDGERCGCGEPLRDCAFWSEVGDRAWGGWDRLDLEEVLALQREVDRNRFVPLMLAPWASPPSWRRSFDRYRQVLARLYQAIAASARADVIVDASKHVSTAVLLGRVEGVDRRIVHLVRDPRGVAHSWGREVDRPDALNGVQTMARLGPARVTARWVAYDLLLDAVRGRRSILVRYESFVEDPAAEVGRMVALAGHPGAQAEGLMGHSLTLGIDHTASGNPLRFRSGALEIAADDGWRGSMPSMDRRLVTAVAAPVMLRYGYARRAR